MLRSTTECINENVTQCTNVMTYNFPVVLL